ncbi:putative NBD/HSP70 family sugar kinase [Novosphingobium sp. SG751A]|uniref:ROK family transcriptional regulator n=1 Tax=Novosphingobium sp. SG751A TaxID=2587000 RepID=UPI001554D98D|nr:ROK family transcriptional regulator [Novosphingobium sp. SG751A]NOW44994.1 putative NBD/HSP70 family sugar kinase [Novosphingobium sp. SG751A]
MRNLPLNLFDEEKRLIWRLRTHGPQSRSDLAMALQVSNAAITKLSRSLMSLSLIQELDPEEARGRGRPTVPLTVAPTGGYSLGVTMHTGTIELALVNYAGGTICHTVERVESINPHDFARFIERRLHELAVDHRLLGSRLLGVGMSVPGPALSKDGNRWNVVDTLPGWRNVPLKDIMTEGLNLPVWLENDATASALAEYYLGGLIECCSSAVLILLGHGVGAGVISDRRLLRGEVGGAGEIGMLYPKGPAGRPTTVDLIATLQAAGCSVSSLADFEGSIAGFESVIECWLDRAAAQLAVAVNSAIAWFDPGAIRLASPLPSFIMQKLADRLNAGPIVLGDHHDDREIAIPPIDVSMLGGASSALGAALLPIHASILRN